MGQSRITLATLLALSLLNTTSASAEEASRDPFFVELKGPDEPASQVIQPTQPATPVQRQAQPVRQPQAAPQSGRRYGPVRPTDTLWSLASKHRPSNRVSVYQTMVAIYDKNPGSFADGNINHILVGSSITLPSEAEARRHTDAQARQRFNSDNASWKGLSPKYLASKQSAQPQARQPVKPAPKQTTKPAAPSAAPIPAPVVAPVLAVTAAKAAGEVNTLTSGAQATVPVLANAASGAPAPLPVATETVQAKPGTEMALALEDANAQLGQVTEMNHRLKLRLQSLTEEVETLKAQLQDQLVLQKEVAELRANPVPPVAVAPPPQNWLTDLLASPLNLAMVILLPVLLVLALVTLWLRARARRELEEQEKNLSETTSVVMGQEMSEFDQLIGADIDEEPVARAAPYLNEAAAHEPEDLDLVFSDEGEQVRESEMRDPELVPELDLAADEQFERPERPEMDLASEFNPAADEALMSEEELQAALFADLNAELDAEEDRFAAQSPAGRGARDEDDLPELDFSDLDTSLDDEPAPSVHQASQTADELLAEWGMSPEPVKDPNELALADFEDAFAQVEPSEELKPRAQAAADDFVEIDSLLADANANQSEQEPYQGFSLNVGLDGFPEVLPESAGFDVDADDGGVGAKLDLARAYLEIDDKESARELLVEASEQGNDKQRSEAEKLLKRLA
ncbi:pilus assembly protein FimV [Aeromonas sp. BIGb0405]|uniref:FimV/HubP family polar landmark protein n=1 Tax=Aeromonas sp. BIGb0405 TaxID=2940592 RepID=UPI0021673FE8|nr:FimV/HubP family polar landmark protein [Aeromonas sp. BIGb0405]MCS3454172.1 pilus assembly protein FimV [Aeromonas sp. BIGb0405]